jgi:hypothetical protein
MAAERLPAGDPDPRRQGRPGEAAQRDPRTGRAAAAARIEQQTTWVDQQIRQAIARGGFDALPGYGRPLRDLDGRSDPDWWVKQLIEREHITGVLPPSLQIRKEDAELDGRLDRLGTESDVRREVADFNDRVRWALYRPPEGPPMVTRRRDPDLEVERWHRRREERVEALRAARRQAAEESGAAERPRWRDRLGSALTRRTGRRSRRRGAPDRISPDEQST